MLTSFVKLVVHAILSWVLDKLTGVYNRYQENKANREENKKIREKNEKAETPEEREDAAEDIANKW